VYFIRSMVSPHQWNKNNGAVYSITSVLMDKQALSRLVNLVRSWLCFKHQFFVSLG
jgi:hypothetical protein